MMRSIRYVLAAMTALFIISCGEKPDILKVDWQPDGNGYVQFRTNDTADYDKWFVEIPAPISNTLPADADWHIEADLVQKAGTVAGARGIIFNYDAVKHYRGLVFRFIYDQSDNLVGQYSFIFNIGFGPQLQDPGWTAFSYLNYDPQVNKLRADYNYSTDKVTFSINGHVLSTAYENDATVQTGAGFIDQILSKDNEGFPYYYSDRRFKLTLPVVYPAP